MNAKGSIIALLLFVFCDAAASDLTPARIGRGDNSYRYQISFPGNLPAGDFEITVFCHFFVLATGMTKEIECFEFNKDWSLKLEWDFPSHVRSALVDLSLIHI